MYGEKHNEATAELELPVTHTFHPHQIHPPDDGADAVSIGLEIVPIVYYTHNTI